MVGVVGVCGCVWLYRETAGAIYFQGLAAGL
jgi:hypothetical protein